MGKAARWSPEERAILARAYVRATHNGVKGADQKANDYMMDIYENVKELAPITARASGSYHYRGAATIYNYFRDYIAKDIQTFNASKRIIHISKPAGTTKDTRNSAWQWQFT